jgi:hypothetical protein
MNPARRTFTATTFMLWSALLAWAAYFLILYVGIALACARGFADVRLLGVRFVPGLTVGAFLIALAITVALVAAAWRRQHGAPSPTQRFVGFLASVLGLLALAAIAWTTLPPILLHTGCA